MRRAEDPVMLENMCSLKPEPVALSELRALVRAGDTWTFKPQGVEPSGQAAYRKSAVLVLFWCESSAKNSAVVTSREKTSMRNKASVGAAISKPVKTSSEHVHTLLLKRSTRGNHHAGQLAFPGGGIEETDAHPAAAALREAQEEAGLRPATVEILGTLQQVAIPVSRNLVTPVIAWWHDPHPLTADTVETHSVIPIPVRELLAPAMRCTSVKHVAATVFRGDAFKLRHCFGGGVVWGFTGMLLSALFQRLHWEEPWDKNVFIEVD